MGLFCHIFYEFLSCNCNGVIGLRRVELNSCETI